jgi:hypothetical protein
MLLERRRVPGPVMVRKARASRAYSEPSVTAPVDGDVVVWGPGRTAFTMTPDAAEQTALRILEAVRQARGQTAD